MLLFSPSCLSIWAGIRFLNFDMHSFDDFFYSLMTTTYKVVVTNVPPETSREDLEPLLKDTVAAIDVSVNGENQMVTLTYTNKEDAEK